MHNVLSYLEQSALRYADKAAVIDGQRQYTYAELRNRSRHIGGILASHTEKGKPVAVYMEKGADALCAFFGIVYAGCCYSMLNPELPDTRLAHIQSVLQAGVVITDRSLKSSAGEIFAGAEIMLIEDLLLCESGSGQPADVLLRETIDTDPLYINFTSGSTGEPKGIVVSHRSVIDFINIFTEQFNIESTDIIANQAPFDFDVSVKDIYSAIKTGATLAVVPRELFSAPAKLLDFLSDHQVTVMIWAVSALSLISTFHGLDYRTPSTVRKVMFSGEVMPYKHLKDWRLHLPETQFVNLYGPTEITCNCTFHILDNRRDYSDGIPIGRPFENEDVFLLDEENNRICGAGKTGELCVRGTALAAGYYNLPEQTSRHFVQNPLNTCYPELIYRTGDLAVYDENGDLFFCGRKDFQIKYMGHRIELEEIEREMSAIEGVEHCCCVFDEKKSRLKGFYVGSIEKDKLHATMKERLPIFMVPGFIRRIEAMPLTKNGKIDRRALNGM